MADQLQMKFFPNGNRLKSGLESGKFTVFVETPIPEKVIPKEENIKRLLAFSQKVGEIQNISCCLALIDRARAGIAPHIVGLADKLPEANRDKTIIYMSGADTTMSEMINLLQFAADNGYANVVPVSGSLAQNMPVQAEFDRNFCDSVKVTALAAPSKFYVGAVTNPFQYTVQTLLAQYFNLCRKLSAGAGFVVTQAGWDMLKLQSLKWYLSSREIYVPLVARLIFLTPDTADKICSNRMPGVFISEEFKAVLAQELQYSKAQFEAAQYRRLELQVAGCKLLGYSGIQLAGLDHPEQINIATRRIADALVEYTSFNDWLKEYNASFGGVSSPMYEKNDFFLFDRVLRRQYPDETPEQNEGPQQIPGWKERKLYHLRKFLFANADKQRAGNSRVLKMLFNGCRGCDRCLLPQNSYLCPHTCPKRLTNGPCGGVNPDGTCENGKTECVFVAATRLARWCGELPRLASTIGLD